MEPLGIGASGGKRCRQESYYTHYSVAPPAVLLWLFDCSLCVRHAPCGYISVRIYRDVRLLCPPVGPNEDYVTGRCDRIASVWLTCQLNQCASSADSLWVTFLPVGVASTLAETSRVENTTLASEQSRTVTGC
jgi:hypothetical protein